MTPEQQRQITKNIARMERLRRSLERQFEELRDLKSTDPRYMQKFRRLQQTVAKLKEGGAKC
jgi:hypothetical protein